MTAASTDYGVMESRTALGSMGYGSSGSGNGGGSSYVLNSVGYGSRQSMRSENNPSMFHRAKMGVIKDVNQHWVSIRSIE